MGQLTGGGTLRGLVAQSAKQGEAHRVRKRGESGEGIASSHANRVTGEA